MSFSREAGRCGACGSTYPAGYWHFCPPAIATQEDLAAMQARAERAERERDDARASNALLLEALTERTQQRDEAEERVQRSCDHAHELLLRVEHAERLLAEAAPVVEAAELWAAEYAATGGDVSAVWATTHRKLAAAVAALRASPESVGGAGVSEADDRVSRATYERARDEYTKASEALRKEREAHLCTKREASDNAVAVRSVRAERDALKDERDAVKRERKEMDGALEALTTEQDALKADLAAAQEFARVAEASWLGAEAELKRRDAEFREEWAKRQALEKDLAAARGEVERLRTEIAGDSHTCANGTVRPYPSMVCSLCVSRGHAPPPATGVELAKAQKERDAALALVESVRAVHEENVKARMVPPPATEAPISERARLVYEGAVWLAAADLQDHWDEPERPSPLILSGTTLCHADTEQTQADRAREYAYAAAYLLAAAERAAKAPQAEG